MYYARSAKFKTLQILGGSLKLPPKTIVANMLRITEILYVNFQQLRISFFIKVFFQIAYMEN